MTVSVIIPVLNEEATLRGTLDCVAADSPHEIIVVDGGSEDRTVEIARPLARVIESPRGRAAQQNRGAEQATGDVLLFLHADCRPEPGWRRAVARAAQRPHFAAGAFRMRIDSPRPLYRTIERAGDLRVRWLGLPYGDQGIFLLRQHFHRWGRFPPVRFMEDLMFMQRVRRYGRVELVPHHLLISPRRWQQTGVIRQTARNWSLTALVVWGSVHPDRLASRYPAVR